MSGHILRPKTLRKPARWMVARSPTRSTARRLWRDVESVIPMWGDGKRDIVSDQRWELQGSATFKNTKYGRAVSTDRTTGSRMNHGTGVVIEASDPTWSVAILARFENMGTGLRAFWAGNSGVEDSYVLALLNGRAFVSNNGGFRSVAHNTISAGDWVLFVVVAREEVGIKWVPRVFQNGVNLGEVNGTINRFTSIALRGIGGRDEEGIQNHDGEIAFLALWKRELEDSEVGQLTIDPFIMLRPRSFPGLGISEAAAALLLDVSLQADANFSANLFTDRSPGSNVFLVPNLSTAAFLVPDLSREVFLVPNLSREAFLVPAGD